MTQKISADKGSANKQVHETAQTEPLRPAANSLNERCDELLTAAGGMKLLTRGDTHTHDTALKAKCSRLLVGLWM